MPHTNAYLLFGCDDSVFIMRGDPRAGGGLEQLDPSGGGVVGPAAWCHIPAAGRATCLRAVYGLCRRRRLVSPNH
jgi:hypothetical protein